MRPPTRRQVLAGLASPCASLLEAAPAARPVLRVDVAAPTKDKPQSKLWFAQGSWWAWLPVRNGSSIWRRLAAGWERQPELDRALEGLPGQADVWAGVETVCAVLVEPRRLAVVQLRWDSGRKHYRLAAEPRRFAMPESGDAVETATIARDGGGRWWIAYNFRRRMWVRMAHNAAGDQWTEPIPVSERRAAEDDICAIVAMPGGVGVVWSDQEHDAVYFRRHSDTAAPESWEVVETAEQGGKTADDHINLAVARDRTLFAATKNSVDRIGHPQQVLRVRDPRGQWSNHPYAVLTREQQPTRPIVQLEEETGRLYLLHTVALRGRPARSIIVAQTADSKRPGLIGAARTVIDAGTAVNNVTGSKAPPPRQAPWIVLASDAQGNVYEARLDGFSRRA